MKKHIPHIILFILLQVLPFSLIKIFAQRPLLMIPRGHSVNVEEVAISADDRYVATGSWDKTVRIWELATGKELKVLNGYKEWIYSVAFSPDNKFLASGGQKELHIYDMQARVKEIFKQDVHDDKIEQLAFSPNSSLLATASTVGNETSIYELKIWNTYDMSLLKRVQVRCNLKSLRFNSNRELLAIAEGYIIHIDPSDGTLTQTEKFADEGKPYLSPDGRWFITTGFEKEDRTAASPTRYALVNIIDRQTRSVVHVFKGQTLEIKDVGFSPDSRYITTSSSDNTIFIYDLKEMKLAGKLTDKMSYPAGSAFTSDGKTFISGNYDGIVRIYDFDRQTIKKELGGHANIIYNIDLSPDGRSLAVLGRQGYYRDGYIQLLNLDRGAVDNNIHSSSLNFTGAFSLDKKYFVSGSFENVLTVMDAGTLQKISSAKADDVASSFAISRDGKQMLSFDRELEDKQLLLRSLPSGRVLKKYKLPDDPDCVGFSPEGRFAFAGMSSGDKTVRLDLQTGAIVKTYSHKGQYADVTHISKILVGKDGNTLITGDNGSSFRFWNISTGAELGVVETDIVDLRSMIMLPGGDQFIATGGESSVFSNSRINVIDIEKRQVVKTLKGHDNSPTSLAVTPDGKFLFSGSFDRTVRLWKLATGEQLATMVFFGSNDWVIVGNGGRFDGTPEGMRQLYYTRDLEVLPLESSFEQFFTPNLLPRILNDEVFAPAPVDINTLKPAPVVKISLEEQERNLTVEDDIPVYNGTKEQVNIKVKADCPGDAVAEIRLFQNGKLVQTTRNLTVEDDKPGEKTLTKTFPIKLMEGANRFKAIAFNTERTESTPVEIIVNFKPARQDEQPAITGITLHLMIIGINAYKNPKYTLNYAKADATSFKEQMERPGGIFSEVKLHFLADADASKSTIENHFNQVIKEAKPKDVFVFYFAGHGVMSMDDRNKEFYIVPYDVLQLYGADDALAQKGISAKELQEFSKNIPAQKQLFILDACQSAGALEAVANRGAAEEKAIAQLARSTGTHWLTASGSEQFATEFAQLGHGVFTYALLEGLKGGADNGDRQITVNELKAYIEIQVPELSQKYKGSVQYPSSYGLGNDFPVFIKR